MPLANRFGIRFANQAMFHPLKYLAGLLECIEGDGSHVFENTEVDDIDDACTLKCAGGNVSCRRVIVATHVPLQGKAKSLSAGLLQSRLAAYSTYAVAARLPAALCRQACIGTRRTRTTTYASKTAAISKRPSSGAKTIRRANVPTPRSPIARSSSVCT